MDLNIIFNNFKIAYASLYNMYDGINGHCSIFAYYLYEYFSIKGFSTKIYTLNKGIHFWIEVESYIIDSRGIFTNRNLMLNPFKKYVVSERITEVSVKYLNTYITKRFGKIL